MPLTAGQTPTDSAGARAGATGYSPGKGVVPIQLGTATPDGAPGAGGQLSAPLVVTSSATAPALTTLVSPVGTNYNATVVSAPGELRVIEEPTPLFLDTFDAGLDTVNKWKTPTSAGGGVAASNVATFSALGSGTTINGYSYLESQMTFPPATPGWLYVQNSINIEFPVLINAYRFWGLGTSPGTPTAAAPLTDAAGWEVTTTGKLAAVTYQGGTRFLIADLSVATGTGKQPQDTNPHSYIMYYKGDRIFWALDSMDSIIAQTTNGGPGPNVNSLPLKFTAIAGTIAPTSSAVVTVNAAAVADTTRSSYQLGDGVYPWRKTTVAQFHNADNQALSMSPPSYGILTGGVSQVINPLNNLDRQREAGLDQVSALGISASAANFAQAFLTTVPTTGNITISTATATITPANMFGVQVGAVLTIDVSPNVETAVITAVTATTATIIPTNLNGIVPSFRVGHTVPYNITGFLYNQERDAAGELDGASGKGTAVAAEYEYNGGGPGAANYDRARNLQGKGLATAAVSSGGGTASTSMVLASVAGLTQGQQILLSGGSAVEVVYTALNYVVGSTTVPLQSAIVNGTQTTATWSIYAAQGPDSNEYLIDGEGTEFISAYNPATKRGRLVTGIAGALSVTNGGRLATPIAAGVVGNTVIKASAGRIAKILVTTTGTNPLQVFDNASTNSGTIIAALPASPAIGAYDFQLPGALGITVAGNAANPAVTISYD